MRWRANCWSKFWLLYLRSNFLLSLLWRVITWRRDNTLFLWILFWLLNDERPELSVVGVSFAFFNGSSCKKTLGKAFLTKITLWRPVWSSWLGGLRPLMVTKNFPCRQKWCHIGKCFFTTQAPNQNYFLCSCCVIRSFCYVMLICTLIRQDTTTLFQISQSTQWPLSIIIMEPKISFMHVTNNKPGQLKHSQKLVDWSHKLNHPIFVLA